MEERFLQQLKKGVLELLVLQTICRGPTYGYEAVWQQETGRAAPRKIYSATEKGREETERRLGLWAGFRTAVDHFCGEDAGHE